MTRKSRPVVERTDWPARYEFRVAGGIGPFVRSALPEFTDVPVPAFSVLTGTVRHIDDLRRLLDALEAHGLAADSHRVRGREYPAAGIDGRVDEP
jgi:hypothetical protein